MLIDTTIFQALLNRVETLEMGQDKAIVQLGNLRIENLEMKLNMTNNVQKLHNYQQKCIDISKETQILQDEAAEFALNSNSNI